MAKFRSKKTEELFQSLKAENITPLNMSDGNKKLHNTKDIRFLIFNLPAKLTCPNKTKMCSLACYAIKAEVAYPTVKPARIKNLLDSLKNDFVKRLLYTILLALKKDRSGRKLIVRIHESGDFYSEAYADKWLLVAELLKAENVTFICYTKSFTYFDGKKLPKNFKLRASLWADTPQADREIIKRNKWNIYTAVDSFKTGDTFTRCRCNDCATCKKCWQNYTDIRCEIH